MKRLFQPEPRDVKRGERLEMRADGKQLTFFSQSNQSYNKSGKSWLFWLFVNCSG
ncbi:TPA: hypothetical protein TZ704_001693 [Streptococcus suis]|nr:hypothetical protein [Streptococcus suis]